MSHRVVIVEDSQALNELLCDTLRHVGYQVEGFFDAESLSEYAQLKDTDVMLLDVQLPGESGLQVAKRLRKLMPAMGIIILTTRTSNQNRIEGYDSGADYYLPKPISPKELVDAVSSLIRRKQKAVSDDGSGKERCTLSRFNYTLSFGERAVKLSGSEVAILVALSSAPDKQLEHWQLMDLLGKESGLVTRASLDVRIYRLRGRLAELAFDQNPIFSVRGIGYKLGLELEIL